MEHVLAVDDLWRRHQRNPAEVYLPSHQRVISRLMLPLVFLPRGIACELFLGVVELDLREHGILLGEVEDLREPGSLVEDLLVLRRVVVDVLGVINSME